MRSIFDNKKNLFDSDVSEPVTVGFVFLISLAVFAFKCSTGDFKFDSTLFDKLLSLFVVGACVFAVGGSFCWLGTIIKTKDKTIEELKEQLYCSNKK